MASLDTQWAVQSIMQLSHQKLRARVASSLLLPHLTSPPTMSSSSFVSSKAIRVTALPRVMQTCDGSRLLLLTQRRHGIAGVELGYGARMPWVPAKDARTTPASCTTAFATRTKKARLLASYLQRQGFETTCPMATLSSFTDAAVLRPPLVVHTNLCIGWKLNPHTPAFPIYAHTLSELSRLRGRDLAALRPTECLVSSTYCEWENWREVLCEPGWDFFAGSDAAVERILKDGVAAPLAEEKDDLSKVEVY